MLLQDEKLNSVLIQKMCQRYPSIHVILMG